LTPGVISGPFEGFNLPAGLLAITQAMPMGFILSLLFLILTLIFVATTGDSMSFVIASTMSQDETPSAMLRVFWGVAMAVMAIILISTGSGSIGKLQSFIVITAVPVSLVLLPSLWDALRITLMLGRK
ncbi:MAG: BCCT family transporter, partial [Albidovulum sp.]